MTRFIKWINNGEYTAYGEVFDVGNATKKALRRFEGGKAPLDCGGLSENDNGNGSLMRILPALFYIRSIYGEAFTENYEAMNIIHNISALTHAHKRSLIACGIYISVANMLIGSMDVISGVERGINNAIEYYKDCVLLAVNLGEDTDTVAAVAGGLAGLYYGYDSIPKEWISVIAKREYIERLCNGLSLQVMLDRNDFVMDYGHQQLRIRCS